MKPRLRMGRPGVGCPPVRILQAGIFGDEAGVSSVHYLPQPHVEGRWRMVRAVGAGTGGLFFLLPSRSVGWDDLGSYQLGGWDDWV